MLMTYVIEKCRIYGTDEKGKVVAEILFPETDTGVYTITHTFVDGSLRGMGIAGELVSHAVEQIKNNGGKVTASCSYAQKWLEKHGI